MIINIKLTNFRNLESKLVEFVGGVTVIVGPNGIGKTNILESLFLLSTGKSFKAKTESEMLRYATELARISARCRMPYALGSENHTANSSKYNAELEVVLTEGSNGWPRKKLLVNGVPKRLIDFAGNFKTVLFGPWDLDLVTGSPSLRRKFLDTVLSQVDKEYRRCLLSYEKGLRQRNKILWRIREDTSTRFAHTGSSMLAFWNQLLIKNGDYITTKREEFIEFCNNSEDLYKLVYSRSVISPARLEQYSKEEVAAATTLVGPHRDDFSFIAKSQITNSKLQIGNDVGRDLASYGSRGEQRMGVLWLKMKELDYIEHSVAQWDPSLRSGQAQTRPTLLLDDIFSELDHEHRDMVMELAKKQQTIITTADEHLLGGYKGKIDIIRI